MMRAMAKVFLSRTATKRLHRAFGVQIPRGVYAVDFQARALSLEGPCVITQACSLEGKLHVGAFTSITNLRIRQLPLMIANASFGRYCSVAPGVWVAPAEHPLETLSTSFALNGGLHNFGGGHRLPPPPLCNKSRSENRK